MTTIAYWTMICFAVMAAYQTLIALWFACVLRFAKSRANEPASWPKIAILMSLRGADPELCASLQLILNQEYPDFKLHVVVDSFTDAAYRVVQQAAMEFPRQLDLCVLTDRRTTCGLQCSAFVQAYQRVDADAGVVVTIDGDLMPHATWLKELVAPLLDANVGATFGNRWFAPRSPTLGSLVRYLWNAAAVVPMAMLSIPWGGCLAMRRAAFDQSDMLGKWSTAIVHDAPIMNCLKRLNLKIRFVPGLMMPIRERCSWAFCLDFIKRQMTWTRLYHGGWNVIVLHAMVTTLLWLAAIGLAFFGLMRGDWLTFAWSGGSLVSYVLVMLALVVLLENSVQQTLKRRGQAFRWLSVSTVISLLAAMLLAQATHFVGVLLANSIRQVTWRGVTYRLNGPWDIELQQERQFDVPTTDASL